MDLPTHHEKPSQILRGFFIPSPAAGGHIARPKGAQLGLIEPKIGAQSAQNRRAVGAHSDPIRGAHRAGVCVAERPQAVWAGHNFC